MCAPPTMTGREGGLVVDALNTHIVHYRLNIIYFDTKYFNSKFFWKIQRKNSGIPEISLETRFSGQYLKKRRKKHFGEGGGDGTESQSRHNN